MNEGAANLQRVYEEIIKLSAEVSRLSGKLEAYVTHEKHAEDAVRRDARITENLFQSIGDLRSQLVHFENEFPERARTIIQAEIPSQIDLKNKRDSEVVRRAQTLGIIGASGGVGGLLWAAFQYMGNG